MTDGRPVDAALVLCGGQGRRMGRDKASLPVGPEVMLDIAGAAQPVVVRSADNGDLTTLVMPVGP